jgi:ribA/ribD-fused uncharacterized protein
MEQDKKPFKQDRETLKQFYKSRSKLLEKDEKKLGSLLIDYDDDGNLVEKNKEGSVLKTIPLPNYRPISFEEFDEIDKKRDEAIAIATKQFEEARSALYQEYQNPERMDSTILQLNRKLSEADQQLQFARFPLRYVSKQDGIVIKTIDFRLKNEIRKYPYDIAIFQTNPYQLEEQYVRIGEVQKKPVKSVNEIKEDISKEEVILFEKTDTNEYGFLSLDWSVQIPFHSMTYHSVKQALYAELAKVFNDQSHLDQILLTESPDEIVYKLEDVPGDKDENEAKWNENVKKLLYDINLVKFTQYPELGNRLLETRNAVLGAYVADDMLMGIGISLDRMESKKQINWTGQNLLGKALMDIRGYLKNKQAEVQAKAVSVRRKKPEPKSMAPVTSIIPEEKKDDVSSVSLSTPVVSSIPVKSVSKASLATTPSTSLAPTVSNLPVVSLSTPSEPIASTVANLPSVSLSTPSQSISSIIAPQKQIRKKPVPKSLE